MKKQKNKSHFGLATRIKKHKIIQSSRHPMLSFSFSFFWRLCVHYLFIFTFYNDTYKQTRKKNLESKKNQNKTKKNLSNQSLVDASKLCSFVRVCVNSKLLFYYYFFSLSPILASSRLFSVRKHK